MSEPIVQELTVSIDLIQYNVSPIKLFYRDDNGNAVDMSSFTFEFIVRRRATDTTTIMSKSGSDFNATQAASGIVTFTPLSTDTDVPVRKARGEVRATGVGGSPVQVISHQVYVNIWRSMYAS